MLNDRTESGDKQSQQARIRREHIIQIVIDIISSRKEHRTKMHINKTESGDNHWLAIFMDNKTESKDNT